MEKLAKLVKYSSVSEALSYLMLAALTSIKCNNQMASGQQSQPGFDQRSLR